jgi:hypothetical protein
MSSKRAQPYDLRVQSAPLDPERIGKFAWNLANGIAGALDEGDGPALAVDDFLALCVISAWMNNAGAQPTDSIEAMLRLRIALVRAGGLDEETEPVPLLPSDHKVAILNLARYLEDLVMRAAITCEIPVVKVVNQALQHLYAA